MFVSESAVQYKRMRTSNSWRTGKNNFIIYTELNTALSGMFFDYLISSPLFNYDKIITQIYFKKMGSLKFLTLPGI
jgi:hypothetical protein